MTRPSIAICNATPTDRSIIADFNARMAAETEDKPLDPNLIGPGVGALLADRNKGRYWLARIDGKIVGQIMVTYEWSDWRNGMLWWIQSVYVAPDYRRQGVFSVMYKHVESLAKAHRDARGVRLYVERGNERAQRTYRALGMAEPRYLVMESIF